MHKYFSDSFVYTVNYSGIFRIFQTTFSNTQKISIRMKVMLSLIFISCFVFYRPCFSQSRERAYSFIESIKNNKCSLATSYFNNRLKSAVDSVQLFKLWNKLEFTHGTFKKIKSSKINAANKTVLVVCEFNTSDITIQVSFDGANDTFSFY
jgi:hypothetical protein